MKVVAPERGTALAGLTSLRREGPFTPLSWLEPIREEALGRFEKIGFPTPRDEEWRKTSVTALARAAFTLADPVPPGATDLREALGAVLPVVATDAVAVFVNGRFAPSLSRLEALPDGVRVCGLAEAIASDRDLVEPHLARHAPFETRAFTALNTAFFEDGAFVHVPDGCVVAGPIHLVFLASPAPRGADDPILMVSPRVLVTAGRSSEVTLVESYAASGPGRYLTNAVTEIVVERDATVDHYRLQRESDEAYHISSQHAVLKRTSRLTSHSICLGAALARNDSDVLLEVEGAECALNGLYLADGARHVDNHTTIDHAAPRCTSRELYKGVLGGRSRGVFNGKIIVRPDSAGTDSRQSNRNLLLSDEALVDTKPELQIHNNDVKCSHAAAIGQLDEAAIFYLRSRGLGLEAARGLLVRAFTGEVVAGMRLSSLRAALEALLPDRTPAAGPAAGRTR